MITSFEPFSMEGYRSKVAGHARAFIPNGISTACKPNEWIGTHSLALVAAKEALADSGLQMAREDPRRVGVIVGAGMGGMVMGDRRSPNSTNTSVLTASIPILFR